MRRFRRIVLGGLLALLALAVVPATIIGRAVLSAPPFEGTSIKTLPAYQEPGLLARAWALPAAAAFGPELRYQSNGSVCGPASLANVFRSLGEPATSEAAVLEGSGRCWLAGHCFMGLKLDDLAEVARRKTGRRVTVLRDLSPEQFREHLLHANDPGRRYVVNFHRKPLFGAGGGHHSPIGGYLPAEDLVLVLDVNARYKPWLVPRERLYGAMDTVDSDGGRKRGLLLIE